MKAGRTTNTMTTTKDSAGWKTARLDELLTPAQLTAVQGIVNAHADPFQALPTLRAYLDGFKDELLAKGLISDYLAYAIVAGVVAHRTGSPTPVTLSGDRPQVRVHIHGRDTFTGVLIGQTDTHYLVAWSPGGLMGEWFAKRAVRVECLVLGQPSGGQP